MVVIKIVAGIVIYVLVKFGDHRRWSEPAARGAHAQPLWAARPASLGSVV